MLPSEQNTPEIKQEIQSVAEGHFDRTEADLDVFFEHGHWWVRVDPWSEEPRTYSVVDAEPGLLDSEFDFEEV